MNPELPKPVRDALAKQTAGEVHPSADVLASFVEQTLPQTEKELVTNHLAQCADCREVVFLASDAAEELVEQEQEQKLMPVFPIPRISPALRAEAQFQSVFRAAPASAAPEKAPRRKWALRLVWAVPVAAAVVLASGALLQWRRGLSSPAPQLAARVASNAPALPPSEPQHVIADRTSAQLAAKKPTPEMQAKTVRATSYEPKPPGTLAMSATPSKAAEERPAPKKTASSDALQEPAAIAIGSDAKAGVAVAPTHNTFAESAASPGTAAGGLVATPQISRRGLGAARTQWRITADGHLEYSGPNGWESALTYQTTTFHAVSAVGNDVWAGGDDGALFHSSDRGQHWKRVRLTDASGAETGAIVSIQFDDPQHGTVTTDGDARWSTADGGVTWARE